MLAYIPYMDPMGNAVTSTSLTWINGSVQQLGCPKAWPNESIKPGVTPGTGHAHKTFLGAGAGAGCCCFCYSC